MLNDRENLVRSVARGIKSDYNAVQFDGLKKAVTDSGILLIESQQVIIPSTWYRPELDKIVIFTRKPRFKNLRHWFLSHEFGHALLGHQNPEEESAYFLHEEKEREAELFADLIRGKPKPNLELVLEVAELMVTRPRQLISFASLPGYRMTKLKGILENSLIV